MKKGLKPLIAVVFVAAFFISLMTASASDSKSGAGAVTFTKDVAPIFYKNCVACHRPNELAPMSLVTYKEARPWARSIREKVISRDMPPWHADPHFGQFANERRLTEQEISTVVAWVDGGAKEGNPKDLPPAPNFPAGWAIGKPDLILSMAEDYTVAGEGADDYLYFRIPTNFKEDRWIQAVEFHPGNRKVVHHAVALMETPEMVAEATRRYNSKKGANGATAIPSLFEIESGSLEFKEGTIRHIKSDVPVLNDGCSAPHGGAPEGSPGSEILCIYAPGRNPDVWPAGTAKKIPAGANIILQMHYSKVSGKPEKDRTSLGLIFAKAPVEKAVVTRGVSNFLFKIPAGATSHEVTSCWTFKRDIQAISYMPHMHVRGKDMKYEAVYPDGRRETLLSVPQYSFSWQTLYELKQPLSLPKGTKIMVTAHYDNSERNKYNPDPKKDVRYGEPTYEEMMIGFVDFIVPKPREHTVAKVDPRIYDAYVGQYQLTPKAILTLTKDGDKLLGEIQGQRFELFPESETEFFLKVTEAQVSFVKNEKGEVTELVFVQQGQTLRFKRMEKATSPAENK